MSQTIPFCQLQVGDVFCIPYHVDHSFEHFVKMPFNKAKCLLTGNIHAFGKSVEVWTFEPTGSTDTN